MTRQSLPISKHFDRILSLISRNDFTIVKAGTGTGKSSELPWLLHIQNPLDRIVVTQPHRMAAIRLAEYVAWKNRVQVGGQEVGYHVARDKRRNPTTKITYVTAGLLLEILKCNREEFKYIILDEAHSGDRFMEMIFLHLKRSLDRRVNVKVILLSATIDVDRFVSYFRSGTRSVGAYEVPAADRNYPLAILYAETILALFPPMRARGIIDPVRQESGKYNVTENYEAASDLIELLTDLEHLAGLRNKKLPVMMFVPGVLEIEAMTASLKRKNEKFDIRPFHSRQTEEERVKVSAPVLIGNVRTVFLATNISESSITLPRLAFVIDTCHTRLLRFDKDTHFTGLVTQLAGKEQCDQRAGRCGRTGTGYCFRLISKKAYDALAETPRSELTEVGLDMAYLQIKDEFGSGTVQRLLELISPPDLNYINENLLTLREVGALTVCQKGMKYDRHEGDITAIGRVAVTLFCDPRIARLIVMGRLLDFEIESIIIGMAMANSLTVSLTFTPKLLIRRMELCQDTRSDSLLSLAAYAEYLQEMELGGTYVDKRQRLFDKGVSLAEMRNVDASVLDATKRLEAAFNFTIKQDGYTPKVMVSSPNVWSWFQIWIAASAYPSVYRSHPRDLQELKKDINDDIGNRNPVTTVRMFSGKNVRVPENQIPEVTETLRYPDYPLPDVWKFKNVLIVKYLNSPADKFLGGVPRDIVNVMALKTLSTDQKPIFFFYDKTGRKVMIKGPRSPIAINFLCEDKTNIKQDRFSVNLFVFEPNLEDATRSIMCGLHMSPSIDKDGRKFLVAKNSTILKPHPGMFEIFNMVFAHRVRLVENSRPTDPKYVGALVGLGNAPDSTDPLSPSADKKIFFDVQFDSSDFVAIHEARDKLEQMIRNYGSCTTTAVCQRNDFRRIVNGLLERPRAGLKCGRLGFVWNDEQLSDNLFTNLAFDFSTSRRR